MPDFKEETWAAYLRWCVVEKNIGEDCVVTLKGIHYDDWMACKVGNHFPTQAQYEGAELLTGLPQRWFIYGDTKCMDDPTAGEVASFLRTCRERGIDPWTLFDRLPAAQA